MSDSGWAALFLTVCIVLFIGVLGWIVTTMERDDD